jgi:hypothetical protein
LPGNIRGIQANFSPLEDRKFLVPHTITVCLALWGIVKLWPSLFWFTLMLALFSFFFTTRIFKNDPRGLFPHFVRWSYGLTTLVFIVFPEAMTQGFSGDDTNMKFYQRILDYLFVTSYSVFGVLLYDAIVERLACCRWTRGWPPLKKNPKPRQGYSIGNSLLMARLLSLLRAIRPGANKISRSAAGGREGGGRWERGISDHQRQRL